MSSVLAGFLVRLGFVVDKDEQAKFQASIDYAGKRMKEIAMRGAAMGTAFTAAFAKSTQEVNRFYNLTNHIGGTVRGYNNVASAVAKVGGNAEDAAASLQSFANKIMFLPGMEQQIKNITGVEVTDKAGKLRDYGDILLDLRKHWQSVGDAVGRNEAAMMGLDGIYASVMKRDFPAELRKTNKQQGELADMVDKSADSVHRLSNEFSRTWEIISMGSKAAFGTLSDSLGLDKVAAKVNDKLSKELPAWIQTEKNIWDQSHGFGDYLKNFFFKADEFQDAERYKRHLMDDEQVQKFLRKKYTKQKSVLDDEAEEGVSIVDDFDKKGTRRSWPDIELQARRRRRNPHRQKHPRCREKCPGAYGTTIREIFALSPETRQTTALLLFTARQKKAGAHWASSSRPTRMPGWITSRRLSPNTRPQARTIRAPIFSR